MIPLLRLIANNMAVLTLASVSISVYQTAPFISQLSLIM